MKSLIKNIYGFYVMRKLLNLIVNKHGQSPHQALKSIDETIQYATDKSLNHKWN